MYEKKCIRVKFLSFSGFIASYGSVNRATALNEVNLFFGDLLFNIVSEVAVRNEKDFVIVNLADNLNGR